MPIARPHPIRERATDNFTFPSPLERGANEIKLYVALRWGEAYMNLRFIHPLPACHRSLNRDSDKRRGIFFVRIPPQYH